MPHSDYSPDHASLVSRSPVHTNEGIFTVSQFLVTRNSIEHVFYVVQDMIDWSDDISRSDEVNIRLARIFNDAAEEIGMIVDNYERDQRIGYFRSSYSAHIWMICEQMHELQCDAVETMSVMLYPSFATYSSILSLTESIIHTPDIATFLRPYDRYDPLGPLRSP